MDNKKNKIMTMVFIISMLVLVVSTTYAFFAPQAGGTTSTNAIVTSNTTDLLTFSINRDISFTVTQADFAENGNNQSGDATATATLTPNNKNGAATMNYYLYLNIESNSMEYSSQNTNQLPELMLQVFDDNNELVTISSLGEQVTVKGVTGYDITGVSGLITILDNHAISASNNIAAIENWRIVVTLINLDVNQNDNTGKEVSAKIIIQKDDIFDNNKIASNLVATIEDSGLIKEYRGDGYYHDENDYDSLNPFFTRPIYYWDASTTAKEYEIYEKWNVVFADSCWQAIRTTDNGGIKLLYNGEPTIENDYESGDTIYYCGPNRTSNAGLDTRANISFAGDYYYGTSFNWNPDLRVFSLVGAGDSPITLNATNYSNLLGKFTCKLATSDGTCATIYYIDEYIDGSNAYAISLKGISYNDNIGSSSFNSGYLKGVNYMSNEDIAPFSELLYVDKSILDSDSFNVLNTYTSFMDLISFIGANGSTEYSYNPDTKYYQLINDVIVVSRSEGSTLILDDAIGKYVCSGNGVKKCKSLIYFIALEPNNFYYRNGTNGVDPGENFIIKIGTSITNNQDGTYTINDSTNYQAFNWYNDYSSLNPSANSYFFCKDYTTTTCSYADIRIIRSVTNTSINYYAINSTYASYGKYLVANSINDNQDGTFTFVNPTTVNTISWFKEKGNTSDKFICLTGDIICNSENIVKVTSTTNVNAKGYSPYRKLKLSNSVNYRNGSYEIDMNDANSKSIWDFSLSEAKDSIKNAHYVCLNADNKISFNTTSCQNVGYIYRVYSDFILYINLQNGKYVNTNTFNELYQEDNNILWSVLYSQSRTNDSYVKETIDNWYKVKMLNYTTYVDGDEIYCNDKITSNGYGSWNLNATSMENDISFNSDNANINCINKIDSYSVNDSTNGNGLLTYPVGLVNLNEMNIIMNNRSSGFLTASSNSYWTLTPKRFVSTSSINAFIASIPMSDYSSTYVFNATSSNSVRPVIALKPSAVNYYRGDGSVNDPYVIEVGNNILVKELNVKASKNSEIAGKEVRIYHTNDSLYTITSFKINGVTMNGNSFIMPDENVTITDVSYTKDGYSIINNNDDIIVPSYAKPNDVITLKSDIYVIKEFKLNGETVRGNSFTMPNENAVITEIVTDDCDIVEIESHIPIPSSTSSKTYFEHTYEGATSITIDLTLQTSYSSNYLSIINSTGTSTKKNNYSSRLLVNKTITIPNNYIKIVWYLGSSAYTNAYGFKARIIPNYN